MHSGGLEEGVSLGETGGRRIMYIATQMAFWQGFLPEDPDHDLDVYIRNLNPRLAGFILRHRRLRLAISWYRTRHPWIMFVFLTSQALIVHPVAIYLNWGSIDVVINSCYGAIFWLFLFTLMFRFYLQQTQVLKLLIETDRFVKKHRFLYNDEQNNMFTKTHNVCNKLGKYVPLVGFSMLFITNFFQTLFLYSRTEMYFRGWYPYDMTLSPAYEITLFTTWTQITYVSLILTALTTLGISGFLYMAVFSKIISNLFENIRPISIAAVKQRKLRVLGRSYAPQQVVGQTRGQRVIVRGHYEYNPWPNVLEATERVFDDGTVTIRQHELDLEMCSKMAIYVQYQQAFFRLNTILSNVSQVFFIALFLINVTLYGGTFMVFSYIGIINMKIIMMVLNSFVIALVFLFISVLANTITDQCTAVGEALYASDWIEASMSFKRSMLIVMTRANSPVEFKAPGLDPLSVRNFGVVANQAYSTATTLMGFVKK